MKSFKEFVATDQTFPGLLPSIKKARGANFPTNPYEEDPGIISVQNVRAGRVFDARCLDMKNPEAKRKAIDAMMGAVRSILTDGQAEVETVAEEDQQKFGRRASWGELYPNTRQFENGIQIEYWQTATQNMIGRTLWSMGDIGRRPWQVAKEKIGLRTSPEHFYRSQFENELTTLANQKILLGWPQNWSIDTTIAARNIKLLLKPAQIV